METATNNGMCRCCASEGTFKDVKSTYHWMGEEEVYSDMLKVCFDITLCTAEDGDNGGICEVCITQLRNAANFKKQVLHTEEQFKKRLHDKMFKTSIVKVEIPRDDRMESDNNLSEDYSGPEFEVPIKEESLEETKPKKRAAKATSSRSKKSKLEVGETSTKRVQRKANIKIEKTNVKREIVIQWRDARPKRGCVATKTEEPKSKLGEELTKHRANIRVILQCSNATPIRCRGGIGYACCFCSDQYPDPADLKVHTLDKHDDKTKRNFMKDKKMFSYLVKLDITSLKCEICGNSIDTLEQLVDHLINVHDKKIHTDIKNHILPFKFDSDRLRCIVCSNFFNKFKALQEHMNMHYRNYVCDVCDAGFVNRHILSSHTEGHKIGTFNCEYCPKVFNTHRKKKSHENSIHIHSYLLNRCGYCDEKFKDYRKKDEHLAKVHGVQFLVPKCQACDKTFINQTALTTHVKRDHLMERLHKCTQCDMKFFTTIELKEHMVKHTGLKEFQCEVCLKAYGRKKTLREHMRIHEDDRRFKCEHCGQAFVQKCSWRGHMRTKHGELV